MLNEIVDSKKESEVYGFFLIAPQRGFSLYELSKRLGVVQPKLALILNKLVKSGHLKTFSKRNKKYYIVNSTLKLFPALQNSLVRNQPKFEDELYSAIKKLGGVQGAYLSGLFTGRPELPVDLLIIGKPGPQRFELFVKNLERMMEQEINYTVMSLEEFYMRRHSFDRFIKDIFDYPHLVVVEPATAPGSKKK